MTTPKEDDKDICPPCGGWGYVERFSEQAWDYLQCRCPTCGGTGKAKRPVTEPPPQPVSIGRGIPHRVSA